MINRLAAFLNHIISQLAMLAIVICLIGTALATPENANAFAAFSLTAGVLTLSWLVGGTIVIALKKTLRPSPRMFTIVVGGITMSLSLIWIYLVSHSIIGVIIFALFFAWQEYSLIREYQPTKISE